MGYGVSVYEKGLTTTPPNALLCSGGFKEITQEDYDWLIGCMEGRSQSTRQRMTALRSLVGISPA